MEANAEQIVLVSVKAEMNGFSTLNFMFEN